MCVRIQISTLPCLSSSTPPPPPISRSPEWRGWREDSRHGGKPCSRILKTLYLSSNIVVESNNLSSFPLTVAKCHRISKHFPVFRSPSPSLQFEEEAAAGAGPDQETETEAPRSPGPGSQPPPPGPGEAEPGYQQQDPAFSDLGPDVGIPASYDLYKVTDTVDYLASADPDQPDTASAAASAGDQASVSCRVPVYEVSDPRLDLATGQVHIHIDLSEPGGDTVLNLSSVSGSAACGDLATSDLSYYDMSSTVSMEDTETAPGHSTSYPYFNGSGAAAGSGTGTGSSSTR